VDAFSQATDRHPEVSVLDVFSQSADDHALRAFWAAHLLGRVLDQVDGLENPRTMQTHVVLRNLWERHGKTNVAAWGTFAPAVLGAVIVCLDRIDAELAARGRLVFASYDHLDRIGVFDAGIRRRYVRTLLALWLSLSNRYSHLRAKIFLREDLFDASELNFPDATKLRARSVSLEWDVEAL
jgi:hypothetical protein